MKKYISLLSLIGCLFFISCTETQKVAEETPAKKKRPNILFIMSDDHAYQAISAYGHPISQLAPTPNIDRIAQEGALFDRMFCTNSICGPSRAAILTGKYGHMSGFFKNVDGGDFDSSQVTFPKLFQEAGYQTAVVGKWHLGTMPAGFDYSKVLINYGGQGTYYNPVFLENGKDTTVDNRYSTYAIKEDAINWLKTQRDTSSPFLMFYQFKAPHRNWDPAPDLKDLYADVEFPLPDNFNDEYVGRKAASENWMLLEKNLTRHDLKLEAPEGLSAKEEHDWLYNGFGEGEEWLPNDTMTLAEAKLWKWNRYIKDYLRCVKGVDNSVGEMLDYLKESGLDENTIVVYTTDQGFYLGEHSWFDKRWMYEESFRAPAMIRWPGKIEAGTTINDMLMNIDYAPTFLDIAGIDVPKDVQGQSFKNALLTGKQEDARDAVYYHYYEWPKWHHVQPHYGVRTERYKLIHFYYSMDEWELYDLDEDPSEMNNLYGKAGYEAITEELKVKLEELKIQYKDTDSDEKMKILTDTVMARVYDEKH